MSKRHSADSLIASGSRHYTKAELEERKAGEPKAPETAIVEPPPYLTGKLKQEFLDIAPILIEMGTLTPVDADALARYLVAKGNYLRATQKVMDALNANDTSAADRWSAIQDRFFRQCRTAGADFGLSASSRAGLTVADPVQAFEPDDLFGK